jgi:glycogen synthase
MPSVEHVLMTADAVGGVWTFAVDLARALGAHGVRVTLAVTGPAPSDAQAAQLAALPNVSCQQHASRLEWMEDPWDDVEAAGEWLTTLAERERPDVVHLNGYCLASLPWNVPVLVTGHSCVLSWYRAVRGHDAPPEWDRYAARVREGLHAADLVTTPTAAMLEALHRHYGRLARTQVIPNGRAFTTLPAAKEDFVLTAGRLWDEAKNVDAVCSIAASLAWPVRVAGETQAPHSSGAIACAGVEYLGRLAPEEMASWMARSAIYALPARYEPFGLSALEAGLAGCALVLGDIRSLREVWGDAAVFVAPDSGRMLARALERLIDDAAYRSVMATRAAARARLFTAERMAGLYMQAYASLLSVGSLAHVAS